MEAIKFDLMFSLARINEKYVCFFISSILIGKTAVVVLIYLFLYDRLLRELGTNVTEDLVVLMPNLLSFLKHDDPAVVKQSIASGTNLFAAVLEEMALQVVLCKTDIYQ